MSPKDLEAAVALATGESRRTIRRRGFQILFNDLDDHALVDDRPPLYVDWDEVDQRGVAIDCPR